MRGNNDQQFNQILTSSIGQSSTYVIFHDYTSLLTNEEAHFKTRPSILVLNRLLPETSVQIKRWETLLIAQFSGRYCKHNNAKDSRESHTHSYQPFKDYTVLEVQIKKKSRLNTFWIDFIKNKDRSREKNIKFKVAKFNHLHRENSDKPRKNR